MTAAEALEHIAGAMAQLPHHILEAVGGIEVVVSDHPPPGARADAAGVFVQPDPRILPPTDDDEPPAPQGWIALYLDNIRPLDGPGVVAIFLHEVSHALGLDDQKLEAVGF